MSMSAAHLVTHTVIVALLIAAAVVLTVSGHDGTPAWAALGGYAGGGAVASVGTGK